MLRTARCFPVGPTPAQTGYAFFGEVNELNSFGMRLLVPVWTTVDWGAIGLALLSFVALFRLRWDMLRTLGLSAGLGMIYFLVFLT